MELDGFSPKQLRAMTWWMPRSPDRDCEAIVCDGAVRSGKTLSMGLGFFLWAMCRFDGRQFGLCGKTMGSLRRNVLQELTPWLEMLGMQVTERYSEHLLRVRFAGRENRFYVFGGRDESAAGLIQGITFAGILMDEVVLMPRSFVEQACARCSVAGSRLWFNCNPEGPQHWVYREWIKGARRKKCLHLHFTMEDNPSLTPEIRRRYRRLYSGVFYRRFVLGLWTAAEGRVYDFFDTAKAPPVPEGPWEQWYISCDYGTVNPASFGLWGRKGGVWYRTEEFYFDSRREGRQMTDAEYAQALRELAGRRRIEEVIVDPSAASFIECIRRHGRFRVIPAKNDVLYGIRRVSDALKSRRILISADCQDCLREFSLYCWNEKSGGDIPVKENDHAMDDIRYFVTAAIDSGNTDDFFVASVAR